MSEDALDYLDTPSEGAPVSVMTHIGEVFDVLADFAPSRAIDYFDPFSYLIKESRTKAPAHLPPPEGPDFAAAARVNARLAINLFSRQKLTAEGEDEEEDTKEENHEEEAHEEEETRNEGEVPNTPADMRFVASVGIGLSERETVLLQGAIEKLIRSRPLESARFWGKVMGVIRDYYIVSAEFHDGERPHAAASEEEDHADQQMPMEEDSGPNASCYFVCTALGGSWTLLPDVTPQQIVASRSIRQMFTGDLNADVIAPPGRFDGKEKELLRAFIARVTHSCTLAPRGKFKPEEEPEEDAPLASNAPIEEVEEWEPKEVSGMSHFLHRLPCILPQGRTEFWAPEAEEEEKEPEREIGVPILTPITEDSPEWSMRVIALPEKVYWLRSNAWPGLSVVTNHDASRMVMMYFGWGMKGTPPVEWPPLEEPKKKAKKTEEEEEEEVKQNENENENEDEDENEE